MWLKMWFNFFFKFDLNETSYFFIFFKSQFFQPCYQITSYNERTQSTNFHSLRSDFQLSARLASWISICLLPTCLQLYLSLRRWHLRSIDHHYFDFPDVRLATYCRRTLVYACLSNFTFLPTWSLSVFRKKLKTHLFHQSYQTLFCSLLWFFVAIVVLEVVT